MSNARNLGNVGARLQQSQSVGLSAGGNIKAVTFQGSGKLLTDILQLTGGNITIPVGSTRQFTKLQSALDSLSSFIFDDTADVQILLDDETFNETSPINLGHDYGDRITIRGVSDLNFKSAKGSPVLSVSGVNVSTLSATIALESGSTTPAVGDYVNIYAISGRHASYYPDTYTVSFSGGVAGAYVVGLIVDLSNPTGPKTTGEGASYINVGDKAIVTLLSGGNATTTTPSYVCTVSSVAIEFFGYNRRVIRFANNPLIQGIDNYSILMQIGNPESYIGNTFTQVVSTQTHVTFPDETSNYILTFSNATPTNTYLNPGDQILALGQTRVVEAVSSNNKCFLDYPFKTGRKGLSGYNDVDSSIITTPTPYLVKTSFERYRGCHRVAAVNGTTSVTIEIPDYGFFKNSMKGITSSLGVISGFPLPQYGIKTIGHSLTYTDPTNSRYAINYPQSKILKSKLDFSNINSTSVYPSLTSDTNGFACLYLNNSKFNIVDNLVVINNGALKQNALKVGNGLPSDTGSRSSLTLGVSGLGLIGRFVTHVQVDNNSVLNMNNVGAQVYNSDWPNLVINGSNIVQAPGGYNTFISYANGNSGNINNVASIGASINLEIREGTVNQYSGGNAFFFSNLYSNIGQNSMIHHRYNGYPTRLTMSLGSFTGCTLFQNCGGSTHSAAMLLSDLDSNLIHVYSNGIFIVGRANYRFSSLIYTKGIIILDAENPPGLNVSGSYITCLSITDYGFSGGRSAAGPKGGVNPYSRFYFIGSVYYFQGSNNSFAVSESNATFANCTNVFPFAGTNNTIAAAGAIVINCTSVGNSFGTTNTLNVATANSFTPPTIQTY